MRSKSYTVTGTGQVQTGETLITGFSFTGFTKVELFDGTDTGGNQLVECGVAGAYYVNHEIWARTGLYASCSGSGVLILNLV